MGLLKDTIKKNEADSLYQEAKKFHTEKLYHKSIPLYHQSGEKYNSYALNDLGLVKKKIFFTFLK